MTNLLLCCLYLAVAVTALDSMALASALLAAQFAAAEAPFSVFTKSVTFQTRTVADLQHD